MSETIDVRVPDIGDFKDVPVVEVLVKPGQTIAKEAPLVVLESEKASMEVPSTSAGTVQDVKVHVGDRVSQGSVLLTLGSATDGATTTVSVADATQSATAPQSAAAPETKPEDAAQAIDLVVPDIGDFKDVSVVEVLVQAGQTIAKETPLVVLESEKASMEVPASAAGTIATVAVKAGDKVSQGSVLATLAASNEAPAAPAQVEARPTAPQTTSAPAAIPAQPEKMPTAEAATDGAVHASPAIRRFARELGVDLATLRGSGPRGRITREDVQGFVKSAVQQRTASPGPAPLAPTSGRLPPWPSVDFAQYGAIERKPLGRIKKISGPNLHRNWLFIPHITNYDEADVTELEAFRNEINAEQSKRGGAKLTMLAFLIKASVTALQRFSEFNASLDGEELVYKRYYNIGFAADTPNGLIVPVLKNADAKGLLAIAAETAELAGKARDGKLALGDMQGGTFTISSIGGIGGTAFTQIVNAPEVAILGAVRASTKPVWSGTEFEPRLMLPISVSYDHRVIDGAGAARFLAYIIQLLGDFKRIAL
ncbi:MAG: dihydrolipoyllysine-residue acetyltransferase [Candidatus Eremiobacteraeota bacterium]|nr:dihydrolipoyllysine-residue acetyltransferase [Candidatus Eremiobacteraeota bacterium]